MSFVSALRVGLHRVPAGVRTGAAGTFAFCACVLLPTVHRAESMPQSAFLLLPVAPLLLGLGLWLAHLKHGAAPYALLTGFPVALAVSVSRFEHDTALATFSPGALAFAMASLSAYGAAAIDGCSGPPVARHVEHKPLGEVAPVEPETRKQTVGTVVLATVTLGALWLTFAGSWGTPARLREQWGRTAPQGATLTAMAAGVVGALALAIVAPGLRAERGPGPAPEDRRRKLRWLSLVAVSGLLVYGLLRWSGG